ncbi:MAG: ABC transporter ATP-binding protein [Mycoplasmatota bacterium]
MDKLEIKNLKYSYKDGNKLNQVLKNVNVTFESGKMYCIIGESGSGKTTLISLLSGLDSISNGDILFNKKSIKKIGYDTFRLKYVNIVFQSYNLINYMTARENIDVAIDFAGIPRDKIYPYALLESVGIDREKADRLVLKLSGGEQQRVAVARALASEVPIIVADEPTGNLDEETQKLVINLFKKMAKDGKIVIIVTHSKAVSKYADVVYKMKKGILEK